MQRHVDTGHAPDLVTPHSGAVDDVVSGDMALIAAALPVYPGGAIAGFGDARDLDLLHHFGTALAGPFGQRQRDIGGIALAVFRQPDPGDDVFAIEVRIAGFHLGWGNLFDLDPKGAGHSGGAENLFLALVGQRDSDRADATKPCGDPGFGFKSAVKFLAVFRQFGHVGGCAQLRNQARRVPGGAGCQLFAFQQNHVGPAEFRQVIRDRAADNAAADNDHTGFGRKIRHRKSLNDLKTRAVQPAGDFCYMGGAGFTAAADDGCAHIDPVHGEIGVF